jgi:hypothetical protein
MFTNKSDCSKCDHYTVCSYKGRYRDFANDVQKATERGGLAEDKDAFAAIANCRQWTPINDFIRRVNETYRDEANSN